jgi:prolyl 4-hydroxylase
LSQARVDARALVPTLEAPGYLRKQCDEMQAQAPYLGLGYRKGTLPPDVYERLVVHFRANIERFRPEKACDEIRTAAKGTIPALLFEDLKFNAQFAEDLRPLHEEWAGLPLVLSACHGIRCYQRGTFLYNHVDRQPHFVSSFICVDHRLDAPWPLHIEGVDGEASQIDLEPGEFVLYEGTRLAHGRPYALEGEFYAGIFVHYFPARIGRRRQRRLLPLDEFPKETPTWQS